MTPTLPRLSARNPLKPTGTAEEQVAHAARYTVDTVVAAGRGDGAAFMTLYYAKARGVAAYIDPVCADQTERDQLLRQIFLRAWCDLPSLDRPEEFDLWLFRLAHDETETNRTPGTRSTRTRSPHPAIGELRTLPVRLREVISLRYFFALSTEQVAVAFDVGADVVEQWIVQGLEPLARATRGRATLRHAA